MPHVVFDTGGGAFGIGRGGNTRSGINPGLNTGFLYCSFSEHICYF